MLRWECVRSFDVAASLVPLVVPDALEASEFVIELGALAALEPLVAVSLVEEALLWLAFDELSSCTSPLLDWFVLAPGVMLPLRGAHVVALAAEPLLAALALSAGRLPDTVAVRLPVVVVSAPTPAAPLVAFRPLNRLSGFVDVLLGVGFAATPDVVAASVGVPFVPVVAVVAPLAGVGMPLGPVVPFVLEIPVAPAVLVAPEAPYVELPLVPACPADALPLIWDGGQGER